MRILALAVLPFLLPVMAGPQAWGGTAKGKSCTDCHKKIVSGKILHPAFSKYLREDQGCEICHTAPHKEKRPSHSLVSPVPDLCFMCHDRGAFSKKNVHPPVAGGDCSSCHDPHSTNAPSLLREPVPFLCPTCHPDRADGTHVLNRYGIGNVHPVQGRRDPSRPTTEIVCTSCHDPHSSDQRSLFSGNSENDDVLCLRCHRKVTVGP